MAGYVEGEKGQKPACLGLYRAGECAWDRRRDLEKAAPRWYM